MAHRSTPLFRRAMQLALVVASAAATLPARASLLWDWSYSRGSTIAASGTFTTTETADAEGFYTITGITGTRNGVAITGLQTTGTPIPGNEPYNVDNLIRAGSQQLTGDGFGYSTAAGHYASPFYADFLATPGYLEVFTVPPFAAPDTELRVAFTATISAVPEPGTLAMFGLAGGLLAVPAVRRRVLSRGHTSAA